MRLTLFNSYNRNTSICGRILTEHLLNSGRRPQTAEKARKSSNNYRIKEKEKKKKQQVLGMGLAPLGGGYERRNVPAPWEALSPVRNWLVKKWGFRTSKENAAASSQQPVHSSQRRGKTAQMISAVNMHSSS